ncbi:MAG: 2,3-bisphosphoglycerate-independent phosphoglycerate mutase [Syntrophobacterales bacterium]|nr:MAG: 2,3-bisphosphoglycerate-independent phosphoglycerate mutase [Syntrophobacterales bacterium]
MTIVFLILDGLSDRPQRALGWKTPLEAAETPNLDRLASLGSNGLLDPLAPGIPMGSETAHFLIFGYPLEDFPGRAVIEAMGRNIPMEPGDVLCLGSFTTVVPDGRRLIRKQLAYEHPESIDEKAVVALSEDISAFKHEGISLELRYTGRGEGILFLRGSVGPHFTDSDPFEDGRPILKVQPLEGPGKDLAQRASEAINGYLLWAYEILRDHPVNRDRAKPINFLVTKWSGRFPETPPLPFSAKYGLKGVAIENGPLYVGLARFLGLEPVEIPPEKDVTRDMDQKVKYALDSFERGYDFAYIHTKAPDVEGHKGEPLLKAKALEAIDRSLDPLMRRVRRDSNFLLVVTGDHGTPSSGSMLHSGDSIPILFAGINVLKDDVSRFNERDTAKGGMGRLRGLDIMNIILNLTDKANLYGVRHSPLYIPSVSREPVPLEISSDP